MDEILMKRVPQALGNILCCSVSIFFPRERHHHAFLIFGSTMEFVYKYAGCHDKPRAGV